MTFKAFEWLFIRDRDYMKIDIEWPLPSASWPATEMNEYDITIDIISNYWYKPKVTPTLYN